MQEIDARRAYQWCPTRQWVFVRHYDTASTIIVTHRDHKEEIS